ncbi:MAG: IS3 family transposase [Gemmatimonadaceae bacterium]|nr:IS3 family transposase [Actinomycetota bacterium]
MPGATPSYPPEFKREAVHLVRSSPNRSVAQIARELGVSDNSLRSWLRQTEIDQGEREGLTTEEREELSRLRKENKVLRQEKEILRKAGGLFRQGGRDSVSAYRFIEAEKASYPVSLLCRVLRVSRSGYYAWKDRPPSKRSREDAILIEKIREVHTRSRQTYGYPRVHAELRALGVRCNRKRVARLMQKDGLRGCMRGRRRKHTTRQDPFAIPAPDLVKRNFAAAAPNKLWTADITYVNTDEGFLYLAFILDVYSRRVVGWSMANHLRSELVAAALEMAIHRRNPSAGLIHHSDRGSQYTALSFGKKLEEARIVPSMGRVGSALDNAISESFVSTLKSELHVSRYPTREAAKASIFEFVEGFYNRLRRHSSLGYLSPSDYEAATIEAIKEVAVA